MSVGLKLPGSTGARNAITVEGVLKITMFAVQLIFDGRAYLLRLTGIALSVFGKKLPPGASFDLIVFGDPDPAAGANSLGWYGAYKKDQAPPGQPVDARGARKAKGHVMLGDPNPVGANVAVPRADGTPAAGTTTFEASMTVNIAGEIFTLKGKLDNAAIVVEYHAEFDKAVSLGSIETIATEIGNALNFPELGNLVNETHTQIGELPVVGGIVNSIDTATIRITDLVINTATKTYGVGLALDFTTSNRRSRRCSASPWSPSASASRR